MQMGSRVPWRPLLVLGLLGGCAAPAPVEEIRAVSAAFDDLNAASQPLLDDLAVAERAQGRTVAHERARTNTERTAPGDAPVAGTDADAASLAIMPATGDAACRRIVLLQDADEAGDPELEVQQGFCVGDSYYYSGIVDPPATGAFRRGLAAVGDYTHLLALLAEGGNIPEAKSHLQAFAGNIGAALSASGLAGARLGFSAALAAFDPLIELAARDSNAEELERVVLAEAGDVERLIVALRAAAPELFTTLTEGSFRRYNEQGLENEAVAQMEVQRIETYRTAVSNYAVLLEQYRDLLNALVAVHQQPRGALTLAHLAERSELLSARADAWRRTLASLRQGL